MKFHKILRSFTLIALTLFVIAGCNTISDDSAATTTDESVSTTDSTDSNIDEPTDQVEYAEVIVHYKRTDGDYDGWNLWVWEALPSNGEGNAYQFTEDDSYGKVARIELTGDLKRATLLGALPRLNDWQEKDVNQDRFIDLTKLTGDELHIWMTEGDPTIYYSEDKVGTGTVDVGAKQEEVENLDLNFVNTDHTGVYYEIFVRSFADSDGDGVGDFNGITEKLPYLSDLGIEGIWLMPMMESNSYHGYDVTDYYDVESDYGTMEDFENLLTQADQYGIDIIVDLVINHTSAQHPWFRSSKSGEESEYRDWYVWIDDNNPLRVRNGAWGQNIWHYHSGEYYAGYFWDQMPDLNMQNEEVQTELKNIGKYWLEKGVDGYRIDAAMHMFGQNEYPLEVDYASENVLWWHEFRTELQVDYPEIYLVGEIWDSPQVIAPYFKGIHSAFNFDAAHKILHAVKSNSSSGYTSGLESVYDIYEQQNPDFIDAPFLTNHDEDRIATQINNMGDLKMAADLLMMLSGNPYIYYGEEIGLKGYRSNGPHYDETRRLPFIWSDDTYNTTWFTDTVNDGVASAEEQLQDPNSLLNHYKELIEVRKTNEALEIGEFIPYSVKSGVISYLKHTDNQTLLVLHNPTNLDLSLDLDASHFTKTIYTSNAENSTSSLQLNSTIVFELDQSQVSTYITK
ncbi:alpha-amylase family glycosyl hydrolase [Haloplasma contractile]|uniref:Maltooligosyl trehalose synthase Carbohydrate transport protein n=1 Tax=Haloplasma contractile SSD-17B TaxID=1033810 RepID=U2EDX4_9MOLU|nr:alpha-amylase family glycosyl hydrolase [Haloplasma contractile]ERJ13193.1 Maltooligosyl trehalose synthase Carbohydrate transport protein [Haloplasma contractile SSD-17B]